MSDLKTQLVERFEKGIRKSFTPCPLIGPKWLQEFPKGRPADFRFFGVGKLALAIGCPAKKIVRILMRNVSLAGLGVDACVVKGTLIDINRKPARDKKPVSANVIKKPESNSRPRAGAVNRGKR